MEVFDKLSDTIVSVSKDAAQKAKDISDLARIRMEIRSKKEYINKLYMEIGRIYYETHKDDDESEFDDQMALIKDSECVLEELKKQSGQIKGVVKCANCGHDMPAEADFCYKCGSKLDKKADSAGEDSDGNTESEDIASDTDHSMTDEKMKNEAASSGINQGVFYERMENENTAMETEQEEINKMQAEETDSLRKDEEP